MKHFLRIVIFLLAQPLLAQPYGNEWINYSQSYYKFPISEQGIYRISYQDLINSALPISTVNPTDIQLYARGKEVPIYVHGEADGTFNPNDFIEFYAEGNDGWLDSVFYKGKSNQPNPYYSLINDTIYYFLTWNSTPTVTPKRYQIENSTDFGNYFAASYVWKQQLHAYTTNYYDGEILPSQATDPEYVSSEGYMSGVQTLGTTKNFSLQTPNRYSSGPFVEFEMKISGQSNWQGQNNGDHHIQVQIGNQTIDKVFEGYELVDIKQTFSPAEIVGGNNVVQIRSIDDRNSAVDRTAIPYMKIMYPHTMSFRNQEIFEFYVQDNTTQNKSYLEILFFQGGSAPVLYDLTNHKRIRVVQGLNDYKTLIPNGGNRKRCFISAESQIKSINTLTAVGQNAKFIDYASQITDTSFLIITHPKLFVEASRYASYRQSKGMRSLIANVEELYDQFSFGINKNPLAIRNFVAFGYDQWNFPPSHLFLLGKSVSAKIHRKNASAYKENLVPTFGNPAADNLITVGIKQNTLEPLIPQGRLSAKNAANVNAYLDKVIEYESLPANQLWQKQALHFAGGQRALEANQLQSYLNGFALDFSAPPKGGNVKTFRKTSSSPFQTSLSDSIRTLINEGVSLMTFFGHSTGAGNFDISIDSPDKLQNRGKYPFILANSCYAGNYHQTAQLSTAEQYVLEKNKGAIGFIANGNLGLANTLNDYSGTLYEYFCRKGYGKSMAENMLLAVRELNQGTVIPSLKSICLEMSLQGDPAIKLYSPILPDYEITNEDVVVSPREVTTDLDSFKIKFSYRNLGKAIFDSLSVEFRQSFPSVAARDTFFRIVVKPVFYQDEFELSLPIDLVRNVGKNEFSILLDPINEVPEISDVNNQVDFTVLIRSGELIPVYPAKFAIIGSQNPTLKASTAFTFEKEKNYRFELDTNAFFNSPFKVTNDFTSNGGVVEWQPSQLANMPDSAVYFWRVSPVPANGIDFTWRSSSFQFISGQSGWSQAHFDQFLDQETIFLDLNRNTKTFSYEQGARELRVINVGSPQTNQEANEVLYAVDADTRERGACRELPGFLIAVLDSLTLTSWQTPYNGQHQQNNFGQANTTAWCGNRNRSERFFLFLASQPSQMQAMRDFLLQDVPDGNFIVLYSWLGFNYSQIWNQDSSILEAIETLGSNEIRNLPDRHPFIFTVRKGDPSSVVELSGDSIRDRITLRRDLLVNATVGDQKTRTIGPSIQYQQLDFHFMAQEANTDDSLIVELIGVNTVGSESVLYSSNQFQESVDLTSFVNEATYPTLRLKARAFDEIKRTPPQLKRWSILHDEIPDLALNPNLYFSKSADSLQAGDDFVFEIAIQNISKANIDSFDVQLNLLDNQNRLSTIKTVKEGGLAADSTLFFTQTVSTNNLRGKYELIIEVNPRRLPKETNYFNNVGQFDFFVTEDYLNPLLDVTFDGRRIMNREIVSANPEIVVRLDDENSYLALDDTSTMALYLTGPNGQEQLLNYLSSSELKFKPASLPENQAEVHFHPSFEEDGMYRLRVQATDKSGNPSSNQDFLIEFEVVTKSTVTHLMNYPNPFSTSTRFVFTLTGTKVPDQIQIQVMTITGKVVREIDQHELGPIRIGNNITDFAWDGKDEYGDQLANGVYLYRVKMKLDGNQVEHRESSADKFFKEEFGKMYLLR